MVQQVVKIHSDFKIKFANSPFHFESVQQRKFRGNRGLRVGVFRDVFSFSKGCEQFSSKQFGDLKLSWSSKNTLLYWHQVLVKTKVEDAVY